MRSIQSRLSLGLISILLIGGLALAQTSLWLFEAGLQRYLESGLRNESENLLVALARGPQGLQLDELRLAPAYQRPYSGHYFRIDFSQGHWRSRSLWDLELPDPGTTGLHDNVVLGDSGQSLLVLREDYRRFGHEVSITVAQDYTPVNASFERVRQIGLGVGLTALLLILILQRITVQRALRPLENTREQIVQLQRGQRSKLETHVPEELEPLVAQVNHLLAHTEDSLKRSRTALGNLGHALKTPLAVMVSVTEGSRLDTQPALRELFREQIQQIEQRLSRELNRARLSGDTLPGMQFHCDVELPGLLATLSMIHGDHLDIINASSAAVHISRDREDVLELLGNLLDNACKWADSTVRLTITETPQYYCLSVDDDGPGIPEAHREDVFSRGARLDEQIHGHGLGLGIVRDIVQAWGATLQLLSSVEGGLQVRIEVPKK